MAGYTPRQFTCPQAVTHPSSNRAKCRLDTLIFNALTTTLHRHLHTQQYLTHAERPTRSHQLEADEHCSLHQADQAPLSIVPCCACLCMQYIQSHYQYVTETTLTHPKTFNNQDFQHYKDHILSHVLVINTN